MSSLSTQQVVLLLYFLLMVVLGLLGGALWDWRQHRTVQRKINEIVEQHERRKRDQEPQD